MPLVNRAHMSESDLLKKDDDYHPSSRSMHMTAWSQWSAAPRAKRRRYFLGVVALIALYVFFKYIPTDLGPVGDRVDVRTPWQTIRGAPLKGPGRNPFAPPGGRAQGQPPRPAKVPEETNWWYDDGGFVFPRLGRTMRPPSTAGPAKEKADVSTKNVAFLAGNPKSAARIIPLACEMSKVGRNDVHFILLSRDNVPFEHLKAVNAVDESCAVTWHDARPDFSRFSTHARMKGVVSAVLGHAAQVLAPKAWIMDVSDDVDSYLLEVARDFAAKKTETVVELNLETQKSLDWIAYLDSGALRALYWARMLIAIHSSSKQTTPLKRLLTSIAKADYAGLRAPDVQVDIPSDFDVSANQFLDSKEWPKRSSGSAISQSQLFVKKRLRPTYPTPFDAASRLLESFYPTWSTQLYFLLLSPDAELSPSYFHYLTYLTSAYRYPDVSDLTIRNRLMGIVLDPAETSSTLKLSPKASAYCTLFFGDKWQEFHDFMAKRIDYPGQVSDAESEDMQSVLDGPLQEFAKLKGYLFIHPGTKSGLALATTHTDLSSPLEEVSAESALLVQGSSDALKMPKKTEAKNTKDYAKELAKDSLSSILPDRAKLPSLKDLVITGQEGKTIDLEALNQASQSFAIEFRKKVGGCTSDVGDSGDPSAELFCVPPPKAQTPDSKASPQGEVKEEEYPKIFTAGVPLSSPTIASPDTTSYPLIFTAGVPLNANPSTEESTSYPSIFTAGVPLSTPQAAAEAGSEDRIFGPNALAGGTKPGHIPTVEEQAAAKANLNKLIANVAKSHLPVGVEHGIIPQKIYDASEKAKARAEELTRLEEEKEKAKEVQVRDDTGTGEKKAEEQSRGTDKPYFMRQREKKAHDHSAAGKAKEDDSHRDHL